MAIIDQGRLVVQGSVERLLSAGTGVYRVKVDRPKEAVRTLKTKKWDGSVTVTGEGLEIEIREQDVPMMTALLVQSGFNVFAIQPKRSLEDYYLSLLGGDHD